MAAAGCSDATIEDVAVPVEQVDFTRPLPVPPLAESRVGDDGTRVFTLTAQAGTTAFRDGIPTRTWGSTVITWVPRCERLGVNGSRSR